MGAPSWWPIIRRDDSIPAIAARLLRETPERFALAGLSMGGYVAMEVMRQAPERVSRLALLDTSARPDTVEAGQDRERLIALAEAGRFEDIHSRLWPRLVHPDNQADQVLQDDLARHDAGDRPGRLYPPAAGDHGPSRFPAGPARHRDPDPGARRGRGRHHAAGHRPGDGRDDRMGVAGRRSRGRAPVDPRAARAGRSRPSGYG